MLLSKTGNAILSIKHIGAADDGAKESCLPNRQWKIQLELYVRPGELHHAQEITISDPLGPKNNSTVDDYLNESLDCLSFEQHEANKTSDIIDVYRSSLFERLKLYDYTDALHGKCLEIHIWPALKAGQDSPSIHSIQWEQLEDLETWSRDPQKSVRFVTVCRHVLAEGINKTRPEKALRAPKQSRDGMFDVLLVVARPNIYDKDSNVLNPGTVRNVLLRLQEKLNSTGSYQKIRLEIVRPGCMEELKTHLQKRKELFGGKRPYHIIHLDMHGGHDCNKRAFLQFNRYNNKDDKLNTERVFADKLALLLHEHGIHCVILSACKSAVAGLGPSASFSSMLLKHGMSAVLAMSYNMHDSISKRFYSRFYSELFVHRASISTAASKARMELRQDRSRWHYANEEEVEVQDWFVPVVYTSSEESYRFTNHRPWFSWTLFGIIPGLNLWLTLIVTLFIYHLISGKLRSWVADEIAYCLISSKSILVIRVSVISVVTVGPPAWTFIRKISRLSRYWRIRQNLKVLADDRKAVLRIEGMLKKKKMVFLHSEEGVEKHGSEFVNCLAAIWERTHFVAFRGAIDAEWFVQPQDLDSQDDWRLRVKTWKNLMWLWLYSLRQEDSVIIIEKIDVLYPEESKLRGKKSYPLAQRRLEAWLKERFPKGGKWLSPYLMLTALGTSLGKDISEWVKDGPGRSEVLGSIAITSYAKTSQQFVDGTKASRDKDEWSDRIVSWFYGGVSRPPRKGLDSAVWDRLSTFFEEFVRSEYHK